MRNTFAKVMTELAKEREDLCLLSGDIGNRMFDKYKEVAPTQFLNCGIAEANMMSMAAGMGLCGLHPVVYTITPFTTIRCLEQIRIGVGYHESPVTIVGTGSGLSYSELGATHHSLEDIGLIKSIPGIQICTPCDSIELETHLREAISLSIPTYIRIGKKGEKDIVNRSETMNIGKANIIKEGKDIMIICAGPIITEAIEAVKSLNEKEKDPGISSIGTVRPLDDEYLRDLLKKGYKKWITLEEHYESGGLGSSILEWLNNENITTVKIKRIGVKKKYIHNLGNQEYTRGQEEIDSRAIRHIIQTL